MENINNTINPEIPIQPIKTPITPETQSPPVQPQPPEKVLDNGIENIESRQESDYKNDDVSWVVKKYHGNDGYFNGDIVSIMDDELYAQADKEPEPDQARILEIKNKINKKVPNKVIVFRKMTAVPEDIKNDDGTVEKYIAGVDGHHAYPQEKMEASLAYTFGTPSWELHLNPKDFDSENGLIKPGAEIKIADIITWKETVKLFNGSNHNEGK